MRNLRRKMALLLVGIMIIISFGSQGISDVSGETIIHAQETDSLASETDAEGNIEDGDNSGVYTGENYRVEFVVDNRWAGGYNATISIYNTGDTKIENWTVAFPLNESIDTIWNAEIAESYEDYYVIKNAGWNQDIPVGGSISFGITSYEAFGTYPSYYTLLGNEIEIKSGDYSVQYEIIEDWGAGYKARVIITNNRSTVLEDWRLQFDYGDNIANIWDAVILMRENEHYIIGGDTYSQNIPAKENITFEFLVEPGTSETGFGNVLLSEYKAYDSDRYLALMGYMDESNEIDDGKGTDELELYMISSEACERYEIYVSVDGEEYRKAGEVSEAEAYIYDLPDNVQGVGSYTYKLPEMFGKIAVYVKGIYQGKEIISEVVTVEPVSGGYSIVNADADGEGLCDYLEYLLGSDTRLADTDGDGLTDYEEVYGFMTDPTLADTDGNGVSDAEEDFDWDGVTNIDELRYGTDPLLADTDWDGLTDGEEIYEYNTEPLLEDTDGEGLRDGDEIALGFDPNVQDTDDNGVLDCDEVMTQTYTYDIFDDKKPEVTAVSVELSCSGLIDNYVYVENMYNIDMLSSDVAGLVGVPVEIQADVDFDTARITFTYDETALGDTPEENLCVMWYDEENDTYVILDEDTVLDTQNNTVSYVTNHFSTYMIVDKEVWYDTWRMDINYRNSDDVVYYDIMFAVDVSGSMSGRRIELAKTAMNTYIDALMGGDMAGIVTFSDDANLVYGLTSDKEILKSKVEGFKAKGGTDANAGLWLAAEELADNSCQKEKMLILICDGDVKVDTHFIEAANRENITVHCVNVASGSAKAMQNIAYATGGGYYYATTTDDIQKKMQQLQDDTIDSLDMTDTDGDGLYDVYEVNGMRISNGRVIYTDPMLVDTDHDGISDYDELGGVPTKQAMYIGGNLYTCTFNHMRQNPGKEDSDGDGIPDVVDDMPFKQDKVEIVALKNSKAYVPIKDSKGEVYHGGNQGWWADEDSDIVDYGCGLIAMCDLEIYLAMQSTDNKLDSELLYNGDYIERESYKTYVTQRRKDYYVHLLLGVVPHAMKNGIKSFISRNCDTDATDATVRWGSSNDFSKTENMIKEMLNNDIPVVASESSFTESKGLPYYKYEDNIMQPTGSVCYSHYFVIKGIDKVRVTSDRYVTYLRIATYGKERYLKYDEWMSRLSYFTNILYIGMQEEE